MIIASLPALLLVLSKMFVLAHSSTTPFLDFHAPKVFGKQVYLFVLKTHRRGSQQASVTTTTEILKNAKTVTDVYSCVSLSGRPFVLSRGGGGGGGGE